MFLPRAEDNGLILPINEWVLRRACHQAAAWRRAGMRKARIGVNLSAIQFRRQNLPLLVTEALNESGLDPSSIELELTENFLMQDVDQVTIQLQQLRELGVIISIDDFGTGFSSLSYVKQLPVDRLKIDQTFIHDLVRDPNDRAIVAAIINLAHSLKMEVVAEGVETADQFEWLRSSRLRRSPRFLLRPADESSRFRGIYFASVASGNCWMMRLTCRKQNLAPSPVAL